MAAGEGILPELAITGDPQRGSCALLRIGDAMWHAQTGDKVILVKIGPGGEGYVMSEVSQPTMPWCAAIEGGPSAAPLDTIGRPEPWSLAFPALPEDLPDGKFQFLYLDAGGRRTAESRVFSLP
eukprot:Hpha_TRINITY_DN27757_c0_g1::TRINITY_DN27757_c0_g1_i1::g.157109::m.157109